MKNCFATVIVFLVGFAGAMADEPAPAPQPVKYRVTGMFMPERQRDLEEVVKNLTEVKLVSVDYGSSEATFLFDADRLFNRPKPDQVLKRFDDLLRSATRGTFGVRAVCEIPRDKLEMVEIPVAGLDCKACSLVAYEAVAKLDGVERATASFKDGLVTALVDPTKTNRAALEAALKERNVTLK